MKFDILSTLLTYVTLSLVQVLGANVLDENGTVDASRRVISGEIADPGAFKYLVRVEAGYLFCGGSVVSVNFILTAAHCIAGTECEKVRIYPSNWVPGSMSRIGVAQCYTHPQYRNTVNFYYDMALIQTLNNLLGDYDFEIIPLAPPGSSYTEGTPATVAGWGVTVDNLRPVSLMSGNVIVHDWAECNYQYTGTATFPAQPKRSFCTRGPPNSPNTATCLGDSGGPVLINGVLAGVVVGTILAPEGGCLLGIPALHLTVAEFLPWIYSIIEPQRDTSSYPVIEEFY